MLKRQRRLYGLNKLNSDINVVPYIDVMLVLLVIFMITAPLLTQGIHVALPSAKGSDVSTQQTPIILSVDQQGQYFLNINKVPSSAITPQQLLSEVSARLRFPRVIYILAKLLCNISLLGLILIALII